MNNTWSLKRFLLAIVYKNDINIQLFIRYECVN